MSDLPPPSALQRRFPSLAPFARAPIGVGRSPVEQWEVGGAQFWVKRDDLCAPVLGGNKARALEYLLGSRRAGDTVVTVGGVGSTHVLATAVHARTIGVATRAYRWPHESNDLTSVISQAIGDWCRTAPVLTNPLHAVGAAAWRRVRHNETWIPFGGTSPLGMVGHVGAALELAEQIHAGELPEPKVVYVALGSGGTAAGLAAGLAAVGVRSRVIAVRCGPSTGADEARLAWLMFRVRKLLRARGAEMSVASSLRVTVYHGVYAGAYARPHPAAQGLRTEVEARAGLGLDATYSGKACYAAWERARSTPGPVLFWHTFDARWLTRLGPPNR